jgi:Ca2+-binding EF-hand superfamily protein
MWVDLLLQWAKFRKFMKKNTQRIRSRFDLKTVRMVTLMVVLGLGACQSSQTSQPQQAAAKTGKARFDQVDTNHDGKLSRNEASDFLVNETFDSRDANHDGRLSQEEWVVPGDPSSLSQFKECDANHDGVVTKEEAINCGREHGLANKAFQEADTNGDGQLSFAEVQAYYASREGPPN